MARLANQLVQVLATYATRPYVGLDLGSARLHCVHAREFWKENPKPMRLSWVFSRE